MPDLTYGSFFSGYGGLDLAVEAVFEATCAWHSEIDPFASKVLAHHWPDVPNLGDISTIDWSTIEPVDIICGGFPCQDISQAGKMAGVKEGTRSGLWFRYADAIRLLRPRLVVVENVRALTGRGLDAVLGSLADIGFDAEWGVLPASEVGACHRRDRLFLIAWPGGASDHRPAPHSGSERLGELAGGPPAEEAGAQGGDLVDDRGGERSPVDRGAAAGAVELLPTPRARDHKGRGFGDDLPTVATLPPTPTATDAKGSRGHRLDGTPYTPTSGVTLTDAVTSQDWGRYTAAVRRHSEVFGTLPPSPTDERGRLNPAFSEWMMALPAGHVTDIEAARTHVLKCIGNGVVPAQAEAAIVALLLRSSD